MMEGKRGGGGYIERELYDGGREVGRGVRSIFNLGHVTSQLAKEGKRDL